MPNSSANRPVSLVLLALTVGCRAGPYSKIRSACGLDDAAPIPLVCGVSSSYYSITEECSTAVGEVVGLDWDSFGDSPSSFDFPETAAQVIVSAVVNLAAADYGSTSDLVKTDAFLGSDQFADFSSDASEFWIDMLADSVETIEYVESDTRDLAGYWAFGGTVRIFPAFAEDIDDGYLDHWLPPATAALLAHESAHKWGEHTECYQDRCWDADASGAYGVPLHADPDNAVTTANIANNSLSVAHLV